jgi:predicted nucleic acid-binding protein
MQVFIDTNIYLKVIYNEGGNLVSHLEDFSKLVSEKKASLVFPRIVLDELLRKFPSDIREKRTTTPIAVKVAKEETRKKYSEVSREVDREFEDYIDKSKTMILDLHEKAKKTPETEKIVKLATYRKLKGNPPGKKGRLGDEICWETILKYCSQDITIVSNDSDWSDESSEKKKIHPLLEREWKEKTNKNIQLVETISEVLKKLGVRAITSKVIERERTIPDVLEIDYPKTLRDSVITPSGTTIYPGAVSGSTLEDLLSSADRLEFCSECGNIKDSKTLPLCSNCMDKKKV